ncbi:Uu.00g099390.m01.CDS01 [Anthostomella pinea]|uniref:Mediator of RNA polymerase II transcription subunit 1 n=1 Tax=Anthostomella pinea TaxID=933095 RepID=A0AAI8YF76_9PEZI|nr:Uu.00g099390.m01.CDS01 [Anthostomella pinea]
MSTPMRHGPSQQGRTPSQHPQAAPTPQASTPFSNSQTAAAFSPHGPRSSPQQFKNSSVTATSATMAASVNQPVNFDSPSAAAALGAMGIGDLNLDGISVGGLVAGAGRNDEEDRKKRLDLVIDMIQSIAKDSARVSNDGLERLANYLELECLWEPGPSGAENDRVLIIAGRTMGVEVGIKDYIVHEASLTFTEPVPIIEKHVSKASAILLKDLALAPGERPLTKKLSHFRINLERLNKLDKLSVPPTFNCHEAIAGMWESLEKLHRWDVEKLREDPATSNMFEEKLRVLALCNRHGCPLMHTRDRIGLSLDYWKARRMNNSAAIETEAADAPQTWGILIECAPINNLVYNSARVSEEWIGHKIEKSKLTDEEMISTTGPVLDWLEPSNTLLPPSPVVKAEGGLEPNAGLSAPKPPDIIFMATFDPPVIVPHGVAQEIYKISATNPPFQSVTFDALLFPIPQGCSYDATEPRVMPYTQSVPLFLPGHRKEPLLKAHINTLIVDKPVYGQTLSQIPFSHPKDLVAILPILRQYAFVSLLLANSFKPRKGLLTAPEADAENERLQSTSTTDNKFSRFMSKADGSSSSSRYAPNRNLFRIDVVLMVHPVPRLQLVFPFGPSTANIWLEIQLGGRVHIVSNNIFETDSARSKAQAMGMAAPTPLEQWAARLEHCENIGQWVEAIKMALE